MKQFHQEDTLVLVGDHNWGRKLPECEQDLQFIADLPGRIILLRGNRDMFCDAKQSALLNEQYAGRLFFLQDNLQKDGKTRGRKQAGKIRLLCLSN